MKNSKLVKLVLVMIIVLGVLLCTTQVFAANTYNDLDASGLTITDTNNTSTAENNAVVNNTTEVNNTTVTNNTTNVPAVLTTSNTVTYNNTTLPDTGLESVAPVAVIAVVLVISAVYAYRKIQEYKNI